MAIASIQERPQVLVNGLRGDQRRCPRSRLLDRFGCRWSIVAVGTIITDRPPHRSVRARLRIRLLRRMSSVEACLGIGVQNAGWRNPPVQDWGKTFPPHLCALTPADQNTRPEPAHAKFEDAQLGRVPGNSVILVITQGVSNHLCKQPGLFLGWGRSILTSSLRS